MRRVGFLLLVIVFASVRPAGAMTIVAFGDSTTAPRSGASEVYADILRNELPDYGIAADVINAGVSGNTTNHAIARMSADVREQDPDLVIIQFGINDSMVDAWSGATTSRVSLSTYRDNLISMVRTLQADGAEIILMTANAMAWTDTLREYYGGPPYNEASPYDTDDPIGLNVTLVDYVQATREIAAQEQTGLVDVYQMYLDYEAVPGQSLADLLLDGMHPNDRGHRLVGDALLSAIVPVPEPAAPGLLLSGLVLAALLKMAASSRVSY